MVWSFWKCILDWNQVQGFFAFLYIYLKIDAAVYVSVEGEDTEKVRINSSLHLPSTIELQPREFCIQLVHCRPTGSPPSILCL